MSKIYVVMCLGELASDMYYINENDAIKEVELANINMGGDFWYKELELSQ